MRTGETDYYEKPRTELLDLVERPPRRLLDVGCGAGTTGALAKTRWPQAEVIGIEIVADVARRAAERLDRVVAGSAEALDFAAAGIANVDTVLLGDVLEHMVDPWAFLGRLRAALSADAVIAASIPNVENLWLLEQIAAGGFDYADEGLLDRTHLRFFTRRTIAEMFERAGFRIERWKRVVDGRVDDLTRRRILGIMLPSRMFGRVAGRRVVVRGASREDYEDLRTVQFTLVARPA